MVPVSLLCHSTGGSHGLCNKTGSGWPHGTRDFSRCCPPSAATSRWRSATLTPKPVPKPCRKASAMPCIAYLRLHERGEVEKAYPSPLAKYAARQVRDGRKVGGRLNVKDVSSPYCQRLKHVVLERLDKWDRRRGMAGGSRGGQERDAR